MSLNWPIWLLEIAGTISFFGLTATSLWKLVRTWKAGRGWFAKLWAVLLVCAASMILWVALDFHLISFGAQY
jgi:uncharacterized membrane-anchored protein